MTNESWNKRWDMVEERIQAKRTHAIDTRKAYDAISDALSYAMNEYSVLVDRVNDRLIDIFMNSDVWVSDFPNIEDLDTPTVDIEDYVDEENKDKRRAYLSNHVWLYSPWSKRDEYNRVLYDWLMSHKLSDDEELTISYNGKSLTFRKKMLGGIDDDESSQHHIARLSISMDVSIPEEDIWMLKSLGKIVNREVTVSEQVVMCTK